MNNLYELGAFIGNLPEAVKVAAFFAGFGLIWAGINVLLAGEKIDMEFHKSGIGIPKPPMVK